MFGVLVVILMLLNSFMVRVDEVNVSFKKGIIEY